MEKHEDISRFIYQVVIFKRQYTAIEQHLYDEPESIFEITVISAINEADNA